MSPRIVRTLAAKMAASIETTARVMVREKTRALRDDGEMTLLLEHEDPICPRAVKTVTSIQS